jgi:hypothetical protein
MRWHVLIWLLVAVLLSSKADSRGFGNSYTGVGNSTAAAGGPCSGVIDLSAGCVLPMFGGL